MPSALARRAIALSGVMPMPPAMKMALPSDSSSLK
jgi:hypothetical protein